MVQLTNKDSETIMKFDIEVDDKTKKIIIEAIFDYINRTIKEYSPDCESWTEVIPEGENYESFVITERNTSVVFIRKGSEIHVTEYTGYVIER